VRPLEALGLGPWAWSRQLVCFKISLKLKLSDEEIAGDGSVRCGGGKKGGGAESIQPAMQALRPRTRVKINNINMRHHCTFIVRPQSRTPQHTGSSSRSTTLPKLLGNFGGFG
jgi:hypothetical protein